MSHPWSAVLYDGDGVCEYETLPTPCLLFLHGSKVFVVGTSGGNAASINTKGKLLVVLLSQGTIDKADVFVSARHLYTQRMGELS